MDVKKEQVSSKN